MLRASLSIAALVAAGASVDASPLAARATASIPQSIAGYTYKGCYSDLTAGGVRVLPLSYSNPNNTIEGCISVAIAKGFQLAGIEYYGECWVGNKLDSSSTVQGDSACNLVCWGDSTEFCGGQGGSTGAAMQLYQAPLSDSPPSSSTTTTSSAAPTSTAATGLPQGGEVVETVESDAGPVWSNNGCYGDLKYGTRALSHLFAQETTGTVEACVNACQEAGYSLCGVEYQGECWGGDSIDVTSSQVDDSVCNLSCSGDKTQRCGGSQAAGTPGIAPFGASFQLYAQCGDNVATCNLVNATSCSGEYVLYDGACDSTTCPDGYFAEDGVCQKCSAFAATCTSTTNPTSCTAGHVLYNGSCSATSCPKYISHSDPANKKYYDVPATYNVDGVCTPCQTGSIWCDNTGAPWHCGYFGGKYYGLSVTNGVRSCSPCAGYFPDGQQYTTPVGKQSGYTCPKTTVPQPIP
ncbi:hypothetical protein JCM8097_001692 [Rhodosporidiobolus ruineniae]